MSTAVQQSFAELHTSWALNQMLGLDDPARNQHLEEGKTVLPSVERERAARAWWRDECEKIIAYCLRRLGEDLSDDEQRKYWSALHYWKRQKAQVEEQERERER